MIRLLKPKVADVAHGEEEKILDDVLAKAVELCVTPITVSEIIYM